jgi:hypothetical protein
MPTFFSNVRALPFVDYGSGGYPFYAQHPNPGFVLVGLNIRAGAWIDQVTPVFAELLDDGSLGPEVLGACFGGEGGMMRELRVMPGHIVTGIQTRSGSFIDAIRLLQSKWDGSTLNLAESRWTPWIGGWQHGGGVERPERILELSGTAVAIGIAGRSGQYLDNLTLVGADLVRVSGTAVAKGAERASRSSSLTA